MFPSSVPSFVRGVWMVDAGAVAAGTTATGIGARPT